MEGIVTVDGDHVILFSLSSPFLFSRPRLRFRPVLSKASLFYPYCPFPLSSSSSSIPSLSVTLSRKLGSAS